MDAQPILEIERPRSAFELIGATFSLYRRYPWLFLLLAAIVVVPYQALDAIPTLGVVHGAAKGWLSFALTVADLALVVPLVSALHVYAVDDVRQGRQPAISSVARRGIATLSIVSPAVFLTWLGITLGFVALIVPGIILLVRWAVVAQTASLGAKRWQEALDRSKFLTDGRFWHVFALVLMVFVITEMPFGILFPIYGLKTTALVPFLIRSVLAIATSSFTALATAFLYFDLTARMQSEGPGKAFMLPPRPPALPATVSPLDPSVWTDADRPRGWYVDPKTPEKMHFWVADGANVWSKRTAKTPKATLATWRDMRAVREREERPDGPA
jgi:hypothetical protein